MQRVATRVSVSKGRQQWLKQVLWGVMGLLFAVPVLADFYISSNAGGTVGGVSYKNEDILFLQENPVRWVMYFDGSDVGLELNDIDAFYITADNSILFSLLDPATLPGVGLVDDADIVVFTPTSLGPNTAGSFSLLFDGSDVGLSTNSEDIDAISVDTFGRLLISTRGNANVPGATGNVTGRDEDLFAFNAFSFGSTTIGHFELVFDGSDVGLLQGSEDLWGAWIDPSTGDLYLTTQGNFNTSPLGVSGDQDDVFVCDPVSLGPNNTVCNTIVTAWDGDAFGFNKKINGLHGVLPGTLNPTFSFSSPSYSITEGDGGAFNTTINVRVERNGLVTDTDTVQLALADGAVDPATGGVDYDNSTNPIIVTFSPGVLFVDVPIAINGDTDAEADETIDLALQNPSAGAVLGSPNTATLTILNDDVATAVDDTATVAEDDPATTIDVRSNDLDVGTAPISVVTQPANGTVVITNGGLALTYQPDADYCNDGTPTDDFTYTLSPGGSTANVNVTVTCVDDAPVAVDDTASVAQDDPATTIDVLANDTDVDSGPISIDSVTQPANGVAVITNGGTDLTYQPDAGYCNDGTPTDDFTYTLTPGGSTATVLVTVTCPVNPTAVDDTAIVGEDDPVTTIDVIANDLDAGAATISAVTQPVNGTVVITNAGADLTYQPDANYCNDGTPTDDFTYTLSPGGSTANVNVTVSCVDDAPVAVDDTATVDQDDPATTIDVLANDTDVDGGPISIDTVTQPANGTAVITNGGADLTYQPDAGYCNDGTPTDDFTYTLTPGGSTATVRVTVNCPANPTAVDDTATVDEDDPATVINVLANDLNAGAATISAVTQPANGVVVNNGTNVTYQPNANYCNDGTPTDNFTYTLSPGGSTANVNVTVSCVDDAPVAVDDTATVDQDDPATTIDVLANDTDVDGGPISIDTVTQPANGTAVITNGGADLTYQPDAGYCNDGTPTDDFTYTLTPGGSTATVRVTVNCTSTPPTAVDDNFNVRTNIAITFSVADLLSNDTLGTPTATFQGFGDSFGTADDNGSGATIATASGGILSLSGTTFTYDPPPGEDGGNDVDSFFYELNNTGGDSVAQVFFDITGPTVWFIDNNGTGNNGGTLLNPFQTIGAFNASLNTGAGDFIRIDTGIANYINGITLLNNQTVLGEGATGTLVSLIPGLLPTPAGSLTIPGFNGTNPVLTNAGGNAVDLATGNTLRGFNIGTTSGAGIAGSSVGTLTVAEVGISGGGIGISVNGGNLAVQLDELSSSTTTGISLANVSGDFDIATGTISSGTATAVSISGNPTIDLGVNLVSVSKSGSGATGIVLTNTTSTSGGFTVAGNGGSCATTGTCSGGTIDGATNAVTLANSNDVTLNAMLLSNSGSTAVLMNSATDTRLLNVRISSTGGSGVDGLAGGNVDFRFNNSFITGAGNDTFDDAFEFGETDSTDHLTGTVEIINSTVQNFFNKGLRIRNFSGNANVTVSGSTFANSTEGQALLLQADGSATFTVNVNNSSDFSNLRDTHYFANAIGTTSSITSTINGNTFRDGPEVAGVIVGNGALINSDNGTHQFHAHSNTYDAIAIGFVVANNADGEIQGRFGHATVAANGNDIINARRSDGLSIAAEGASGSGNILTVVDVVNNNIDGGLDSGTVVGSDEGLDIFNGGLGNTGGLMHVTIRNNDIGDSTALMDDIGILSRTRDDSQMRIDIDNNNIHTNDESMDLGAVESASKDIEIHDNLINQPNDDLEIKGLNATVNFSGSICADIGNDVANDFQNQDVELNNIASGTFVIEDLVGTVPNFVSGNNTGIAAGDVLVTGTIGAAGANCDEPLLPNFPL